MNEEAQWRQRYEARINSEPWRKLRAKLIKTRGDQCESCHKRLPLELHHKTYERLGRELAADLVLLCSECHKVADVVRARRGRIRSAQALYDAGLNTYASKKYGDNYRWSERLEEEYDTWLERKREDW